MDFFTPQYRRNPNEMVHSLYVGVAHGNRTVTAVVKPSLDRNSMEATKVYGPGLERGQGGQIATLILGGMETTLDEMEYIAACKREKKFVPKNRPQDIVAMCRLILDRRNELIRKHRRENRITSMAKAKRRTMLYLPVGYRLAPTSEPGLQIAVRA